MVEVRLSGAKPVAINETSGMCGGFPHIEDRRIRVAQIVEYVRSYGGVDKAWQQVGRDLYLPRNEFRAAYKLYQLAKRVDEDIARDQEFDRQSKPRLEKEMRELIGL